MSPPGDRGEYARERASPQIRIAPRKWREGSFGWTERGRSGRLKSLLRMDCRKAARNGRQDNSIALRSAKLSFSEDLSAFLSFSGLSGRTLGECPFQLA